MCIMNEPKIAPPHRIHVTPFIEEHLVAFEIVEPIIYHVLAKRYLARDKKYFNFLSEASKISLKLQGGPLNNKESKEFEKKKYFKNSVLVRKFDEAAKKTGVKVKLIDDYKSLLNSKLI